MSLHDQVLAAFQTALGGRFLALYLVGSHGTPNDIGSDIDYVVVSSGVLSKEEEDRLWTARDDLRQQLDHRIDVNLREESQLLARGIGIKHEGRLVGERDIREQIRMPPKRDRDEWFISVARSFLSEIHGSEQLDAQSLDYPDRNDFYYGYPDYKNRRPLIRLQSLTFLATAWLSACHDVVVTNKHDIPNLYAEHIGEGKLSFLDELFATIRTESRYLLPDALEARERARRICEGALPFEKQLLCQLS